MILNGWYLSGDDEKNKKKKKKKRGMTETLHECLYSEHKTETLTFVLLLYILYRYIYVCRPLSIGVVKLITWYFPNEYIFDSRSMVKETK